MPLPGRAATAARWLDYKPRAHPGTVTACEDGTFVLTLPDNSTYSLNRTAVEVWSRCDGNTPLSEMVGALASTVDAPRKRLLQDIANLITVLHTEHLLV